MQKKYASSNLKSKKRVATQCKRLEKSKHFYTLLNLADECQMVTGRNSLRAVLDNQPKKQKVIKMRDTIDAVLQFAIIAGLMVLLPLAGFSLLIQMP